ncbi:MAG TPA: hypothetical protein VMT35_19330 [Ignavibacteriaceae bacterium]|nr:hypothetical protein [Ignavibacteriaceae bacterium]
MLEKESKLNKTTSDNPSSNTISDIVAVGNSVWLGTDNGVSVSTDRGASWTNFYQTGAFGSESISALAYDKYTNTIWAATAHSVQRGDESIPQGSGLRYSVDTGKTWISIPQPVDSLNDSVEIYGVNRLRVLPVTVTEQNLTYDIAFTPGTIWITSFAAGLRKSTNMGETWERVILPTDSLDSISPSDSLKGYNLCISPADGSYCGQGWLNYRAFSVISINDSTLFVGTANGINKSTDGGVSWRKFNHLNQENPISGNFVVALGYDSTDNVLWGSTWPAEDKAEFKAVSGSTDGGENWEVFLKDESVHNFGFKGNSSIAASDNGALRTFNNGISWILPSSIVDDETKNSIRTNVFYSAASEGSDIWLGSADGLAKLTETAGEPWIGTWKVYFASPSEILSDEAFVYPNPFSPRIDAGGLKFKYNTNGKIQNVTIRIFNFGMHYIRTIIQNAPRNMDGVTNPDPQVWDGKDDTGNTVPNGVYFYRIEIGDNDPKYGKILVMQ